jgi:hypothetical protein
MYVISVFRIIIQLQDKSPPTQPNLKMVWFVLKDGVTFLFCKKYLIIIGSKRKAIFPNTPYFKYFHWYLTLTYMSRARQFYLSTVDCLPKYHLLIPKE